MSSNIAEAKRLNALTNAKSSNSNLNTPENVNKLKNIFYDFKDFECKKALSQAKSFEDAASRLQLHYLRSHGIKLSEAVCLLTINDKSSFEDAFLELQEIQMRRSDEHNNNNRNKGRNNNNNNKNNNGFAHKKQNKEAESNRNEPKRHLNISRPNATSAPAQNKSVAGDDLEKLIEKALNEKIVAAKKRLDQIQLILKECQATENSYKSQIQNLNKNLSDLQIERQHIKEEISQVERKLQEDKQKYNASNQNKSEQLKHISERVLDKK